MMMPQMPGNSRVWCFGAAQVLSPLHLQDLSSKMDAFVADWQAHGADLSAAYTIIHDSFLIVAVDESITPPSGCSIDKVFKLLANFPIDFLQRLRIWQPFCNTAHVFNLEDAKLAFKEKQIDMHTLVLNPLVATLEEARENLYIPLSQSWAFSKIQA